MRKILHSIIFTVLGFHILVAQDIHPSHVHATPLLVSPSFAGMFDGDLRVTADFKSQWKSVTTNYQTAYLAADIKTPTLFGRNEAFAFGMEMYSDKAGDLDFRNYGVLFSATVLKTLDGYKGRKLLTGGLKFGVLGNSFNPSKINAVDMEPLLGEIQTNILYGDWSLGLGWFHEMKKSKNIYYISASASHINKPNVRFGLTDDNDEIEELYRKVIIHAGGDFKLGTSMNIMPSITLTDQGPHREILMGSFWKFAKKGKIKNKDLGIYLGVWGRWYFEVDNIRGFDAILAAVRMNVKQTQVTFSYDINTSSLSIASLGRGGPEISITQIFEWEHRRRRMRCPSLSW